MRKIDTHVEYGMTFRPAPDAHVYRLIGVVEHLGDAGAGHYLAYVRGPEGSWYLCDDWVSPRRISQEHVLGTVAMGATLLFYQM